MSTTLRLTESGEISSAAASTATSGRGRLEPMLPAPDSLMAAASVDAMGAAAAKASAMSCFSCALGTAAAAARPRTAAAEGPLKGREMSRCLSDAAASAGQRLRALPATAQRLERGLL